MADSGIRRINVIGTSGSGKSTFGRSLAQTIQAPYLEMDNLYWKDNWEEPSDEMFFSDLEQALRGDSWVLDGNYSRTTPLKWARVQLVIWLDLPFLLTFWQVLRRSVTRAWTQRQIWPDSNNKETFSKMFRHDSVVLWSITSYRRNRSRYSALFHQTEQFPGVHFVRLRSHKEVRNFVAQFPESNLS